MNGKWKVEFYGEGTSWEYRNLSYKRALEIQDNAPVEYMAIIVPEME